MKSNISDYMKEFAVNLVISDVEVMNAISCLYKIEYYKYVENSTHIAL